LKQETVDRINSQMKEMTKGREYKRPIILEDQMITKEVLKTEEAKLKDDENKAIDTCIKLLEEYREGNVDMDEIDLNINALKIIQGQSLTLDELSNYLEPEKEVQCE